MKNDTTFYYRVFDQQRGCYFATGYNSQSMQELINDFHSYVSQGDCDLSFKSWDDVANHLTEIVLEKSVVKFDEKDLGY